MTPGAPRRSVLAVAVLAAALFAASRPDAQQPTAVRGRVEIGIPITTRRPTTAYPTRSVATPILAPPPSFAMSSSI